MGGAGGTPARARMRVDAGADSTFFPIHSIVEDHSLYIPSLTGPLNKSYTVKFWGSKL